TAGGHAEPRRCLAGSASCAHRRSDGGRQRAARLILVPAATPFREPPPDWPGEPSQDIAAYRGGSGTEKDRSMTIPTPIAHTVQQTQEWLKELRDNADFETETTALSVLRVVLHQ